MIKAVTGYSHAVSIHAPREGSDPSRAGLRIRDAGFNPRPPWRVSDNLSAAANNPVMEGFFAATEAFFAVGLKLLPRFHTVINV